MNQSLDQTPYTDEEIAEKASMEDKIKKLMEFFDLHGINYDKFNPDSIPVWNPPVDKRAYPNFEQYQFVPGQHDTQKWLQAVKDIYYKERNGADRVQSIRQVTAGWKITETHDFLNWLRFYEEGVHLKYKTAQVWYENGAPGYFLHVKPDPEKPQEQPVKGQDIDFARDAAHDELSLSEKKNIIEKQRSKIIGRLDSAEKLLRSRDGQIFAGKELEALMEAIYALKKKVQLVNKLSTSTRLYEDMIIREANVLNRKGFIKAAAQLQALADDTETADKEPAKDVALQPASPAPPQQGSGAAGGLPSVGPGMPQTPPESAPNNEVVPKGISKFLENLDTAKISTKDDLQVDDVVDVSDVDDELFVTEAQAIPSLNPDAPPPVDAPSPASKPKVPSTSLEVEEKDVEKGLPVDSSQVTDFDNMIDAAFKNLTVNDVVAKLEDLAKIFKTREVPRQLAVVDMMLDSLGLASFFPSLSEATNKSLESNNYISTRIEDILSKLRGAIKTKEIDLRGDNQEDNPAVQGIKNTLQQNEEKEKMRKEKRKQQENEDLDAAPKETPKVEIDEDLAQPVPPKAPPPPVPAVPPV